MNRSDCLAFDLVVPGALPSGPTSAENPDGLDILGGSGIGDAFLAGIDAVIEGGCIYQDHICPETDLAGALVKLFCAMTMNQGTARTIIPFGCSD